LVSRNGSRRCFNAVFFATQPVWGGLTKRQSVETDKVESLQKIGWAIGENYQKKLDKHSRIADKKLLLIEIPSETIFSPNATFIPQNSVRQATMLKGIGKRSSNHLVMDGTEQSVPLMRNRHCNAKPDLKPLSDAYTPSVWVYRLISIRIGGAITSTRQATVAALS
jgi:hypothetical protein